MIAIYCSNLSLPLISKVYMYPGSSPADLVFSISARRDAWVDFCRYAGIQSFVLESEQD